MERSLLASLIEWQKAVNHPPIILRGARQVGKTYLVDSFGKQYFEDLFKINFEKMPQFSHCFNSFEPHEILNRIYLAGGKVIHPGKTLLFLDEIQECPNAIQALRYFKEDMPALHVIAAGSLLEFTLNNEDFRMPVGRVEYLYLKPLSFYEFLQASGEKHLVDYCQTVTLSSGVDVIVHEKMQEQLRYYFLFGGMPDVVQTYLTTKNLQAVQAKQVSLMRIYRDDFGKYAAKAKHRYMRRILEKAPGLVGQHFKYVRIDPEITARELKGALDYLVDAGLLYKVFQTNAAGLPLNTFINEKKFKLLMLDIGLIKAMSFLSPELLLQEDLMLINQGALSEQFVGQELLAYKPAYIEGELYYWSREQPSSTAEVDYVINVDEAIIPIEVKSGATGRLRSIQLFLQEKKCDLGVRISMHPLKFNNHILSIPLYLIYELERLIKNH